jgi:hypothetical protein
MVLLRSRRQSLGIQRSDVGGISQGEPELHMKPVANGAARYDAITSGITAQYDIKTGLGDEAHSN